MAFTVGTATAVPINVIGVFDTGEAYTGSKELQWYNNHDSIYGESENLMNTMHYSVTANSLNLFLEVPDYARVMIWSLDVEYLDTSLCSPGPGDPCGGLNSEYFRLVTNSGDDLCFGLQNDGGHCDKNSPSDRKTFAGIRRRKAH